MNSDALLLVMAGVLVGFGGGYVTAWRLARRLEHFGVGLWRWDQAWDPQAPPLKNNVTPIDRQAQWP